MDLLEKASVILTPTAYNNGEALCVKPSDGSGDFDFSRNSAATRVNAQGLVENVQILSSNLVQNPSFSEEGVQEISNGSFSQEGSELITNGDFTNGTTGWSSNATLTESNNIANITTTSTATVYIRQNNVYEFGKRYKLTFTAKVDNLTEFELYVGSTNAYISTGIIPTQTTDFQEYNFYFQADTAGGMNLLLRQSMVANSSIEYSEISVREVGQDWSLGTGWSIGEDKAVANTIGNANLFQASAITSGKIYKATFEVSDYQSGSVRINLGGAGLTGVGNIYSANGVYTQYITSDGVDVYMQGRSSFNGSITNISVKEVGMDWNIGSDWSIAENKAVSSGSGNNLQQTINISSNKTYKLTFDVISTSGTLAFDLGGATAKTLTDSGSKEYYFQRVNNNNLRFYGGNYYGSVTNISVIEITDDTNLPRINYEGFSYQDALGSEQVVNGDFEDGSANWVQASSSITISGGGANFDGTLSTSNVRQLNIVESAKQYKVTYTVRDYVQGLSAIRLGAYTTFQSGNGTFTEVITSTSIDLQIYGLSSFIGSIDNVSVKEYLGQEVVPNSGCGSWLFEPQSTNLIEYSEDFSQWAKVGTPTITSNYSISPDGTQNSTRVEFDANERIYFILSASGDITFSVYLKGSGVITLRDNTNAYRQDVTLTSEWARYDLSFNATITSIQIQNQTASIVDLEIWGAMLEENSYPTSLIPTSGSAVTRNQDVCNNGGSLATINSTEGVLYAEIAALSDDLTFRSISLNDGSTNNFVTIRYRTSSNRIQVIVFSGGVLQFSNSFDVTNILDFNKVAISYNQSNFNYWVNGVKRANSTSGNTPVGLNKLSFARGSSSNYFFGKTKAVAVWKEALSDSELQSLTTI